MRGILGFIVIVLFVWAIILSLDIPLKLYKSFKDSSKKMSKQFEEEEEQDKHVN